MASCKSTHLNLHVRLLISVGISATLIFMTFGEYYWQQISEFAPPIGITMLLVLTIITIYKLISTTITILRYRSELNILLIIPAMIYFLSLVLVVVNPKFLRVESYLSEVKYRGCYEGTMNTARIKFRENGRFEFQHIGFFGVTTFIKGSWIQNGDTLTIRYPNDTALFVGTKLLLTDQYFIRLPIDSLITEHRTDFYRGYCKGLN